MATVTSIDLVPGGSPVTLVVEDQNGNALPGSNVVWAPVAGTDIGFAIEGNTWSINAPPDVPAGSYTTHATYNGPLHNGPLVGPDLTINVSITALQYASA